MRSRKRRTANGVQRPISRLAPVVALAALLLALSGTIWFPVDTSVRTTMKVLPFNRGGYTVSDHARGCGSYWDTRQVGHGVGATIQLAAGVCWNGKREWWTWGLHRANCYPLTTILTQVRMTCLIHGGGHTPLQVTYEAHVTSSLFPFVSRTVTLELIVDPQGYVLQLPFQPMPATIRSSAARGPG